MPPASQERIRAAQQELDAIRWGLCETGQRAEIQRIFAELEPWLTERLADVEPLLATPANAADSRELRC